jgi:hypothetical protein
MIWRGIKYLHAQYIGDLFLKMSYSSLRVVAEEDADAIQRSEQPRPSATPLQFQMLETGKNTTDLLSYDDATFARDLENSWRPSWSFSPLTWREWVYHLTWVPFWSGVAQGVGLGVARWLLVQVKYYWPAKALTQ